MKAIILLSITGIATLFAGIFKMGNKSVYLPIMGLVAALFFISQEWNVGETMYFNGMLKVDTFSLAFSAVLCISVLLIMVLCADIYKTANNAIADIYGLLLFSLVGGLILLNYNNLAMLFLGVEMLSIPLYVLAGSNRNQLGSNEASLKYFLLGSFASGFMLFGIALVFGVTGSFYLPAIGDFLTAHAGTPKTMLSVGVLLILAGFLFKVGAAPFHFWAPDVYEGSPTMITAFMATVVKTAAFAAFFKLLSAALYQVEPVWFNVLWVVTALTLFIGNLTALFQKGFKRLLAYSSISHAGYMMIAILVLNKQAANGLLVYSITYSIASIAAFAILMQIVDQLGSDHFETMKGIGRSNPLVGICLTIVALSFAGIPPLAGFIGKYSLFIAAIDVNLKWIVIIAVINSLIGVYYYLRIINTIWATQESNETRNITLSGLYKGYLMFSIVLLLVLGLVPMYIMNVI